MKTFFKELFSSNDGVSSKRVLGAIGFLSLVVFMFMHQTIPSIEAVEYVTLGYGLGTVVEKFSNMKNKKSKIEEPPEL